MGHRHRGESGLAFTLCEERWHLGSARWQDLGDEGIRGTLHRLNHTWGPWHCTICDTTPQAMLMLITEMLITQGVTNMPYKSPHPRHTERNRMRREGGHAHFSSADTDLHRRFFHHHNRSSRGSARQGSALRGIWVWVRDEWVDPDGVMTGCGPCMSSSA